MQRDDVPEGIREVFDLSEVFEQSKRRGGLLQLSFAGQKEKRKSISARRSNLFKCIEV